jgi:hypothetical protein
VIQQRPIANPREEIETELRLLLTEGVPADDSGYPLPSLLRKADTLVDQILRILDRYIPN